MELILLQEKFQVIFSVFIHNNDSINFIIADVAGKGVHARKVMAKASTLFEVMSRDQVDPDEMMFHMNNDLFITKTSGMFVTCVLGKYDLITQEVSWVNGGHQPAIIRDNNGEYQNFESEAPPMGVILQKNKSIYKINKQVLNGKKFYVFTDGLSESLNTEGQEMGIEGSIKIIEDSYTKDSKKHLSDVSKQIIKNSKSGKLDDDLTLISIG